LFRGFEGLRVDRGFEGLRVEGFDGGGTVPSSHNTTTGSLHKAHTSVD